MAKRKTTTGTESKTPRPTAPALSDAEKLAKVGEILDEDKRGAEAREAKRAEAEQAKADARKAKEFELEQKQAPAVSQVTREQLSHLAALQICDLFDALLKIDPDSLEAYPTLVTAIAKRGSTLGCVVLSAMGDSRADEEEMIYALAPNQSIEEFKSRWLDTDRLPWRDEALAE
jgi:hypothetical protein